MAATKRQEMQAAAPAAVTDDRKARRGGNGSYGATTSSPTRDGVKSNQIKSPPTKTRHPGAPKRVRVYVLTYFFSSLTIDKWRLLWGFVPIGWMLSSLAEWFGVPICHTNVQVSRHCHRTNFDVNTSAPSERGQANMGNLGDRLMARGRRSRTQRLRSDTTQLYFSHAIVHFIPRDGAVSCSFSHRTPAPNQLHRRTQADRRSSSRRYSCGPFCTRLSSLPGVLSMSHDLPRLLLRE